AAHKRMFSEYGIWLGLSWGVQMTLLIAALFLGISSNAVEPISPDISRPEESLAAAQEMTRRSEFIGRIIIPIQIAAIVSMVVTAIVAIYASRKSFRAQLAAEGLLTVPCAPPVTG